MKNSEEHQRHHPQILIELSRNAPIFSSLPLFLNSSLNFKILETLTKYVIDYLQIFRVISIFYDFPFKIVSITVEQPFENSDVSFLGIFQLDRTGQRFVSGLRSDRITAGLYRVYVRNIRINLLTKLEVFDEEIKSKKKNKRKGTRGVSSAVSSRAYTHTRYSIFHPHPRRTYPD